MCSSWISSRIFQRVLVAKIGVDTAENEPSKVSSLIPTQEIKFHNDFSQCRARMSSGPGRQSSASHCNATALRLSRCSPTAAAPGLQARPLSHGLPLPLRSRLCPPHPVPASAAPAPKVPPMRAKFHNSSSTPHY